MSITLNSQHLEEINKAVYDYWPSDAQRVLSVDDFVIYLENNHFQGVLAEVEIHE